MRYTPSYCTAIVAALLLAPFVSADEPASNLRSNDPIVKAVQKTIAGVVAIRVPRQGDKDMIGSGIIIDESGLIVTNRHVTGGKRFVKVRLHNGTDLAGEVLVTDVQVDLAVIRINAEKPLTFKALTLAPTQDLLLAERVIAIGSPYGYEGTVSVGIISALNREIAMPNDVTMTGLIQTNAAINPGNSGGPLLNINGEVIGVNVALRDGAQNIAFAINSSIVKTFLTKHFNAKKIAGVDLGLKLEEKVVAEVGDRQRVEVKNAAAGELKSGDQILNIGEKKVNNSFDVERALWNTKPGQKVNMKVSRQGKGEMTVVVTLGTNQGAGQVAVNGTEPSVSSPQAATGSVRSANQR
jgi:serine protease Do